MAQTQKTIRFNQDSEKTIEQVSPTGEPNYNFAVNQIIHRYNVLCEHLKHEFTEQEFQAIAQAYNGHMYNADILLEAKAFKFSLVEAIKFDENVRVLLGDDCLRVDFSEFMEKVDKLTIPQIIAIIHAVQVFWTPNYEKPL